MNGEGKAEGSERRQNLVQGTESRSLWLEKRALGKGRVGSGCTGVGCFPQSNKNLWEGFTREKGVFTFVR